MKFKLLFQNAENSLNIQKYCTILSSLRPNILQYFDSENKIKIKVNIIKYCL